MTMTIYLTNYQRNQILDAMLDSNNDLRLWDQKHETFDEYRAKITDGDYKPRHRTLHGYIKKRS